METWAALIVSCATLITAVGAVVIGIINANHLNEVHIAINSRMDQLLLAHGKEQRAEGIVEGQNKGEVQ